MLVQRESMLLLGLGVGDGAIDIYNIGALVGIVAVDNSLRGLVVETGR